MIQTKNTNINVLEDWYKNAFVISSQLNPDQIIDRDKIDFIYTTLSSFFGASYFTIKIGEDRAIEKISWIHSLLIGKNSIGCIGALHEIATLINYSKTLEKKIQKELETLKRSPGNLRSFFSELFIFYRLDLKGILNRKKIMSGNQEIEGTCILNEKEFLFECRKLYLPNLHELDIKKRLMADIHQHGLSLKHGLGMICTINFKYPIKGEHRSNFSEKIKRYFEGINKLKSAPIINYFQEDQFGTFKATNYSIASLIEIKSAKKYDILFYLNQPENSNNNVVFQYTGKVIANFLSSKKTIYKKLENVLKEKKSQHKKSCFENKIIFLDSETFPEFQMGLFNDPGMYDINEIIRIYNKLNLKVILCIVRRIYLNEHPEVQMDIIRPENLKHADEILKSLVA